ncbi:MAG: hypothetical protein JWM91_3584 [Rhodospirillales bacterium]|nr:hypothetical protein [Rhodospirillales bacterium]
MGPLFTAMLTVTGLLTAYMTFQVFVPPDVEHQMLIAIWVAGLTAGKAITYGSYPPAVAAFTSFPLLAFATAIFAAKPPIPLCSERSSWTISGCCSAPRAY